MMASAHAPGFLKLVMDAKTRIKEVSADQMPEILKKDPRALLIDTREESEFAAGHVKDAQWIGKGIIERDIEALHPDRSKPLYLYCGSGYRSVLAADNLTTMGYTNVYSVDGGWRDLQKLFAVE